MNKLTTLLRAAVLCALLAVVAAGCGGREPGPGAKGLPHSAAPPIAELPTLSGLDAAAREQARRTAGLTETLIQGKFTLMRSLGAVDNGTALDLISGSGMEWGLYAFDLQGNAPDSLAVLLDVPLGDNAWIALADYSRGVWEWYGPLAAGKTLAIDEAKYTSPGGLLYCTVASSDGDSATVNALSVRTINPQNVAPTADLQADVTGGDAPLTVQFDAGASADSDGTIIEYAWDWDGNMQYEDVTDLPLASHTFTSAGVFTVRLRVTDEQFARASATVDIDVNIAGNTAPAASFSATPDTGVAPLGVLFDANGSTDDGSIVRYDWDFNDDLRWEAYDGPAVIEQHYTSPGIFTTRLRVTDDAGAQDIVIWDITVNAAGNNPPVADLLPASASGNTPLVVNFDASGSNAGGDAGDSIVKYEWDFDGNGNWDGDGADPTIAHTYTTAGVLTAKLRVTDTAGNQATDTAVITVNAAPVAVLELSPATVDVNETTIMNGSLSSDSNGNITQYEWDSDANGSFETNTGAQSLLTGVSFSTPGLKTLKLRVTDNSGATATASTVLRVNGWGVPQTPDSAGSTGRFTFMAVVNGNPAISYLDMTNNELRYVRATDASGSAWGTPQAPAGTGVPGWYNSMAVVNGKPAISYYDSGTKDLCYVRATDASGTAWSTPFIVDSAGDTGGFPSLAIVNGNPAISYHDFTFGDLRYVRATDANGTAWGTGATLDNTGNTGKYPSLAIVNGNPAISYNDDTAGDLRYVRATDASGSAWGTPVTPDSAVPASRWTSLVIVNGHPAISHMDAFNEDLRYVRATDASGSAWGTPVTLDSDGKQGAYLSMIVVNGKPAISYYDGTNLDLRYVQATDASGSTWGMPLTLDSAGDAGWDTSLVIVNGSPAISYFDFTNGDLRFIRFEP